MDATTKPEWARTEYVCRCGAKFYRTEPKQKRCKSCSLGQDLERFEHWLAAGGAVELNRDELEKFEVDLKRAADELADMDPSFVPEPQRAQVEARMAMIKRTTTLLSEVLAKARLENKAAEDSGHAKYTKALKALATELKEQLTEEEVRALACVTTAETGMFLLEDGTGVGFVFHGVFGKLLSPEEVKHVQSGAAGSTCTEHVGALLNGLGPVVVEDHVSGVHREASDG